MALRLKQFQSGTHYTYFFILEKIRNQIEKINCGTASDKLFPQVGDLSSQLESLPWLPNLIWTDWKTNDVCFDCSWNSNVLAFVCSNLCWFFLKILIWLLHLFFQSTVCDMEDRAWTQITRMYRNVYSNASAPWS